MSTDDRRSWDKRENESPKAYEAFSYYRDLGVQRSLDKAYRLYFSKNNPSVPESEIGRKEVSGGWRGWYKIYDWKSRAEAYDQNLESIRLADLTKARRVQTKEHRDRVITLAAAAQAGAINLLMKANARLENLEAHEIDPRLLPLIYRAAVACAETAANAEAHVLGINEVLDVDVADE